MQCNQQHPGGHGACGWQGGGKLQGFYSISCPIIGQQFLIPVYQGKCMQPHHLESVLQGHGKDVVHVQM